VPALAIPGRDIERIYREVLAGLAAAGRVDAIGIDSWAVDYGLLDADGNLLGDPFCYRDDRTAGTEQRVAEVVDGAELYAVTGLQHLPFNTIYQLLAEPSLADAATILLVPDLLGLWLTGQVGAEATNASTPQLSDARRGGRPAQARRRRRHRPAGGHRGGRGRVARHRFRGGAVPAASGVPFRLHLLGTWSLVGVELPEPVLTEDARAANFTNEGGVDGTIRPCAT
jgi:rhamnulokinase